MSFIDVLWFEEGKAPVVRTIEANLQSFEKQIGNYIHAESYKPTSYGEIFLVSDADQRIYAPTVNYSCFFFLKVDAAGVYVSLSYEEVEELLLGFQNVSDKQNASAPSNSEPISLRKKIKAYNEAESKYDNLSRFSTQLLLYYAKCPEGITAKEMLKNLENDILLLKKELTRLSNENELVSHHSPRIALVSLMQAEGLEVAELAKHLKVSETELNDAIDFGDDAFLMIRALEYFNLSPAPYASVLLGADPDAKQLIRLLGFTKNASFLSKK